MRKIIVQHDTARYRKISCKAADLPLYFRDFWLDAVCLGGEWNGLIATDEKDQPLAILPVFVKKKLGIPYVTMPPLTPYLGIWLLKPTLYSTGNTSAFYKLVNAFIPFLQRYFFIRMKMHPGFGNWLPFYWKGYTQKTYYIQIIDLKSWKNEQDFFSQLSNSVRKKIRSAARKTDVETTKNVDDFYKAWTGSFERQQLNPPLSLSFYQHLYSRLEAHTEIVLFIFIDKSSRDICGSRFVCIDHRTRSAYSLGMGQDYKVSPAGMGQFMQWMTIKHAIGKCTNFNLGGSMLEGVHHFNQQLNPRVVPYFVLEKFRWKWMEKAVSGGRLISVAY